MQHAQLPEEGLGIPLAMGFYHQAVERLVDRVAPEARYSAGRFGPGSDIDQFDDETSRDHGWGPACTLLVDPDTVDPVALAAVLHSDLPRDYRGFATNFDAIQVRTVADYLRHNLGVDRGELSASEWLSIDEQRLIEVTRGALFRDQLDFQRIRRRLAFYSDDLRLHVMAVEWTRILEEQAFPGRAGSRSDHLGSAIVSARLIESAMRLAFYVDRTYPPYGKWFGSAFQRLGCSGALQPPIERALAAPDWKQRDAAWADVLRQLIAMHEALGLLEAGKFRVASVYVGRPGSGLPQLPGRGLPTIGELIANLRAGITDPDVLALPPRVGSINQMLACRDLEEDPARWRTAYRALLAPCVP